MRVSRPKYLELVRRLALMGSTVAPGLLAACGGTSTVPNTGGTVTPAPSASASTTTSGTAGDPPYGSVTDGAAPCRCSWDPDPKTATRVCKRGEMNYAGARCIPGSHPSYDEGSYYPPAVGPLAPPEMV